MTPLKPMITHCIECKQMFTTANTYTEAGWRETQISGLCEDCFNTICAGSEEETEDEDDEHAF